MSKAENAALAAITESGAAQARLRREIVEAQPVLRRQMMALCGDAALAEDLAQESITRALANLDKFKVGTNLGAWLCTIGKNYFLSALRKRSREVEDVDDQIAGREGREGAAHDAAKLTELLTAINQLPAHMRQAIRLVGILGFNYEDAAKKCNCDLGTIKSRVNRARLLLGEHGKTAFQESKEREEARGLPVGGNDRSFLYALAKKYVNDADGDVHKATAALVERLSHDRAALEEVATAAVREAVLRFSGQVIHHRRQQIAERADAGRGSVVALAAGISAALLDMPLTGGVKLRQASRDLVIEEADRLDVRAREASRRAKWLRLIAQHIPNGRAVGEVIDDTRAQELWNECKP